MGLRRRGRHDVTSLFGLIEAVALEPTAVVLDVDHPGVMQEPVQDGRGDHGVAEQLLPAAEALVRGQDRRALLVPIGNELEKEMRLAAVDGQIPGLVDDDQAGTGIGLALALKG